MIYTHKKLGYATSLTGQHGNWVEFYTHDTGELRWLEREVFFTAYEPMDLDSLRTQARSKGVLVPYEFLAH